MANSEQSPKVPSNYTVIPMVVVSERGIYRDVADGLKEDATAAHLNCYRDRSLPKRAGLVWWDVTENAYGCQVIVNNRHHATIFRKSMKNLVQAVHRLYQINEDVEWKPDYIEESPNDEAVAAVDGPD
jgi:hypothetical protein